MIDRGWKLGAGKSEVKKMLLGLIKTVLIISSRKFKYY
jgi:hypothetical protein